MLMSWYTEGRVDPFCLVGVACTNVDWQWIAYPNWRTHDADVVSFTCILYVMITYSWFAMQVTFWILTWGIDEFLKHAL